MRGPLLALLLGLAGAVAADPPRIAVVLDDIGNELAAARRALALPGPIAYAVLPATPAARWAAREAARRGREVLLHLPMQAVEPLPLGPGGVTLDMTEGEFRRTVLADLDLVPEAVGVNNHMGSLLTRHPGAMQWLMGLLARRGGLYFLDSRTSERSVAARLARENGLAVLERDVFLDPEPSRAVVSAQFDRLLELARRRGQAVAIGHPHPWTLDVLERRLGEIEAAGMRLVPPSALLARGPQQRRIPTWHASLSPSPPASRRSRPSPWSTSSAAPAWRW
ncbi:divergent polysaccharide deacetylase family protein [Inmirania thermothiophila]|uniref:Divergent polysaccharide deacetylase n=1 Tax=Inmirania thermothiophila TaxID=1750597 RepID=A0A3N1Y637_9GAMM|nr:divergent polysaccharide deacetylase family protein [Inmirania thermothiophila]ROR34220.1 hypothetical protein EDC57_0116 [Inmirania thermothiophila]